MGDRTTIEWTEATWNPLAGCEYASKGCRSCYAAKQAATRLKRKPAYEGLAVRPDDGEPHRFTGEIRLLPGSLDQPLHYVKPRLIFVNSMSDLFHRDVPEDFIAEVFARMALCRRHTFQILTKRPQRMAKLMASEAFHGRVGYYATEVLKRQPVRPSQLETEGFDPQPLAGPPKKVGDPAVFEVGPGNMWMPPWPLPNVWLGTSVEDEAATYRIGHLLETPAAVRFLSIEPLIGPVNVGPWLRRISDEARAESENVWRSVNDRIDWVICGGESGPQARPMHPDWARAIRDECDHWGVPFFFKQWGEWSPDPESSEEPDCMVLTDGRVVHAHEEVWFADTIGAAPMAKVGKKRAGQVLDGREWNEFPTGRSA